MTDIKFYYRKDPYGWLSNFERATVYFEGRDYKTTEHFYQSQKAADPDLKEWIKDAPTPYAAMMAGRSLRSNEITENWDELKIDVMYTGLMSKFRNPDLQKKLIETGNAALHEDSPTDMFWGIKGNDMLGKLLMLVREDWKQKYPNCIYKSINKLLIADRSKLI